MKAPHFETVEFGQNILIFLERLPELIRHLLLERCPPEPRSQYTNRFLDNAALAAKLTRSPVHIAEAVQDSSFDPELRIGAKLCFLPRIELIGCIDQAKYAGTYKIFQVDILRQLFVNPAGYKSNHGKIGKD